MHRAALPLDEFAAPADHTSCDRVTKPESTSKLSVSTALARMSQIKCAPDGCAESSALPSPGQHEVLLHALQDVCSHLTRLPGHHPALCDQEGCDLRDLLFQLRPLEFLEWSPHLACPALRPAATSAAAAFAALAFLPSYGCERRKIGLYAW